MARNKPKKITATEQAEGIRIEETSNGVIARNERGRFAKGTQPANIITAENAREMQRKGVLAKRAVIMAEANRSVEDVDLLDRYGEQAHIAALTRTQMQIATTPEAGKAAVLAANWIVDNTGAGEKTMQAQEAQRPASAVDDALAALIHAITDGYKAAPDVVDAETDDDHSV